MVISGLGDLDRERLGMGLRLPWFVGVFEWIGSECGIEVTWK